MTRRKLSSCDDQCARTCAEGWHRTSQKRDGRWESHCMYFPHFVLFRSPTNDTRRSRCARDGGSHGLEGGWHERERFCRCSSGATSRKPCRTPGHPPPSSPQNGEDDRMMTIDSPVSYCAFSQCSWAGANALPPCR
jgi:hypothetical protein